MSPDNLDQDFLDGLLGVAGGEAAAAKSSERDVLAELLDGAEDDQDAVELNEGDLLELAAEFESVAVLTQRKTQLEDELKTVKALLAEQKARMSVAMEIQGTTQFRGRAGESCFFQTRFDTRVEDPEAFHAWAQEHHPELFGINSQTRTSFIRKNYRDQGVAPDSDEFPPGIKVTERTELMVRGVKKERSE